MKNNISNGFQMVQDLIKLTWVPEILESINKGNHRYSEILNSINYISHTELNRKLIILLEKKVIYKESNENNTHYSLLDFGKDLIHIFGHLEDIEDKYFEVS